MGWEWDTLTEMVAIVEFQLIIAYVQLILDSSLVSSFDSLLFMPAAVL